MERNEESSKKGSIEAVGVDQSSIYTVNPSNYTGVSLINCKLNDSNYLTWSRAMTTALITKNKVGMVDGSVPRPPEGDSNCAQWDMGNALVISWIFNTLDPELQSSVACATVAQTLWEDMRERYSQGNETRVYQLKAEIESLKQEGMLVSRYYSQLKTLWDELENYLETPTCSCSTFKVYTAQKEWEKTYQFLMGLGSEFSTVRSNILSHEPAHSLNKVLAMILHEERENLVALSHENTAPDGAAFLGRMGEKKLEMQGGGNSTYGGQGGGRGATNAAKTCCHCGRPGHVKNVCWLLHGYLMNWEPKGATERGKLVFSSQGRKTGGATGGMGGQKREAGLGPNQFAGLQAHQGQKRGAGLGPNQFAGLQAHQAQLGHSHLGRNQFAGLSAHQSHIGQPSSSDLNKFSRISDSAFQKLLDFLRPDDDNMQPNTGPLVLSDVLLVPKFNCNLISASQLSRDLDCCIILYTDYCLIHARITRRTIGVGELQGGVYYLRRVGIKEQANRVISDETSDLWHMRLGHPSRRIKLNGLSTEFWGECVTTAAHLINVTPTSLLEGKSSYEVLFGRPPNYFNLRIFGCLCYSHDRPRDKDKFKPRSRHCMFVGYPYGKKGWRVYDLEKNEIFVTRDVRFCDREFHFLQMVDAGKEDRGHFFINTEKHVHQIRSQGESRLKVSAEGE
ncbi:hypothetical protein CRG98_018848 [Punica granatum]|uniref:CCHC-type domain-containing protein n=1 Tax=Punica granatum TaxID=22663 RepID=A0A2I0JWW2_PUNGR|nr:hypothetical protein CRG98_018848 [Punica granatum]